jgi:trehalose 6-phosphate phosphatase
VVLLNTVLPSFRSNWALFLDVDGTLLEFADAPDEVVANTDLRHTLGDVKASIGGALALVSGRSLEDLDAIFAPLRLAATGLHGYERRDARGDVHREPVEGKVLRWVRDEMQRFAKEHPGALVEDKGLAVALHFRRAPHILAQAEALIEKIGDELPVSFRVQTGKMVFEVKPSGRSKGTAIAAFMDEPPFRKRIPVFIGDDDTDEDGFRWVNEHGGITAKVGAGASAARFRLDGVDAVSRWLEDYVAFLARSA